MSTDYLVHAQMHWSEYVIVLIQRLCILALCILWALWGQESLLSAGHQSSDFVNNLHRAINYWNHVIYQTAVTISPE